MNPFPGIQKVLRAHTNDDICFLNPLEGGLHRSRIYSFLRHPATGHHHGGGPLNMDVHICMGGVMEKSLGNVRGSTSSSQKSEGRKAMMGKNELKEGLRGRIIVSTLSHLSKSFANTHRNQSLS
jgi:hypothetical protein